MCWSKCKNLIGLGLKTEGQIHLLILTEVNDKLIFKQGRKKGFLSTGASCKGMRYMSSALEFMKVCQQKHGPMPGLELGRSPIQLLT